MLLWSQYWRWATPRNTGVQAAVPRRWSHFSRGYSNASLTGGVLHPHRMAPLPKDKLFAKVEAYRAQLERQLRRAQWDSVRPVGAGGQPASDRYGVRACGRKPARFAPPKQLLAKAIALRMSMLTRDTEPFKRMGYSQYFPATEFYANRFNSCALVSSAGSMLGSKLGPEIDGHETVVRFNDAPTCGFRRRRGGAHHDAPTQLASAGAARVRLLQFGVVPQRHSWIVWDPSRDRQPLEKASAPNALIGAYL
ncbi:hypothetical protein HPB51_009770 [Rhipicephalus microplus]|uniref:beta-galactoside alpha-(2,6)-sialyltransferase n=1 Tax=Rhipicephalus microplus TaxID=6941 RepID=A0A9J6F0C6_RHIMP|nr:hypothetical protein HPB51_009770 [Rhipicephalus microplus]